MTDEKRPKISRRRVLQTAALTAGGLGLHALGLGRSLGSVAETQSQTSAAAGSSMIGVPFEPRAVVRVGLIGHGGRGASLLHDLLGIPGVQVNAVCKVVKAGQKEPAGYSSGERDFENLVKRDDLDVVYIPTPWRWHVPMAVAAMEAGKHVFVEVPAASTLEDCWKLVDTSERTRRHCVMLENCCYGENELMVLGMV